MFVHVGRRILAEEVRLEEERREDSEQYGKSLQDADRRHRRPLRPSEARPKGGQGEESPAAPLRPRMARCVNGFAHPNVFVYRGGNKGLYVVA